ncbi:unnamed protein product [Coregonus sp. 'balchen']|nr:unnamed protein product [Coregonus sp. 'balchen']
MLCPSCPRFYQAGVDDVDEDGDPLGGLYGGGGRGSLGCRRPSPETLALALCDPAMQRRRSCEVDSLPESCLDSGMSTLRGSNNGYDSEQEVKGHEEEEEEEGQRAAGNTDSLITEVRNKMVFGSDNGSVLDWKPLEPVSRTSSGVSTRKALSAITNEVQDREMAFRSIAKSYFRRADGVLLLYDVTCEKSFLNVREWVDMIEDMSQDDIPIMLVGNKCDLREQALQDGITCVSTSYGEKLAMC